MPKVGMRMVKSAIAVFLCFVVFIIRGNNGIPFYSAIAAVLCMQPEVSDSMSKGKSRIISTLIGGCLGMVMLYFFQTYFTYQQDFLRYTIISIMIIPLLYIPVALHQPSSSYLSCVVFLSITVSHIGDQSAFIFGCNRILDTLIGIFLAIFVNAFHLPHKKHTELLIEMPFSMLLEANGKMNTYTKIHINQFLENGMNLLLTSSKTPDEALSSLMGLRGKLGMILMDGVIGYDLKNKDAYAIHTLEKEVWKSLYLSLRAENYLPFVYEVRDMLLYAHYEHFQNEVMKQMYMSKRKKDGIVYNAHQNLISEELDVSIVAMELYLCKEEMQQVHKILSQYQKQITWVQYPYDEQYVVLRIYPSEIAEKDIVSMLCKKRKLSDVYRISNDKTTSKEAIRELKHVFYKGK